MHCDKCGAEIKMISKYCQYCGKEIDPKKTEDPDVTDIVEKLRSGSETEKASAFEKLYNATYNQTFGHILWKIKQREAAEDLVQETYTSVWKNIGQLRNAGAFYGWYWTIADRKCNDWFEKNKVMFAQPVSDDEGNELDILDNVADDSLPLPEDGIADEELKALLLEAMYGLPANQRHVVRGFYYEKKKIRDIADEMDSNEKTIKTWLRRGRLSMAKNISAYANANGLKLAPVCILPVMAILSKEDAYACELSKSAMWSVIQKETDTAFAQTASHVAVESAKNASKPASDKARDSAKDAVKKAQEAAKKVRDSAKTIAESEEMATAKKAAKEAAIEGAKAAKEAAKEARKAFDDKVAPEAGKAVAEAAKLSLPVKIGAAAVAGLLVIGGIGAVFGHKPEDKTTIAEISEEDNETGSTEAYEDNENDSADEDDDADYYVDNGPALPDNVDPESGEVIVTKDGAWLMYVQSLNSVPDETLEEIGEAHKSCINDFYKEASIKVLSTYNCTKEEYVGSYFMFFSADGEMHNAVLPVYKLEFDTAISDKPICLYEFDILTDFYCSEDGMYVANGNNGSADIDSDYINRIIDTHLIYDPYGKARFPERPYGTFTVQWREPNYVVSNGFTIGYENPAALEEAVIRLAKQQGATDINMEATFDISDLESHEYHKGNNHVEWAELVQIQAPGTAQAE